MFPTRTGARRDKDNIRNRVVAPAVKQANFEREAAGLPPIGVAVTPHTLRRTYISLLLSAGAEVPYVQAQVGHTDPKVTLEIYAHVLKRRDRSRLGTAFDALMRDAIPSMQRAKMRDRGWQQSAARRRRAAGDRRLAVEFGPDIGPEEPLTTIRCTRRTPPTTKKSPHTRAFRVMGAAGFEPATSRV